MPDQWDAFRDADEWSGFPDEGGSATGGSAIDGDTLRFPEGDVRLWGMDAPELKQQGWDRQGNPVPIGDRAKASLDNIATGGSLNLGRLVNRSYGRDVRPVNSNGSDVGAGMLRSGNALAAPSYLQDDEARRTAYMEAERLARQNGLGVHGVYAQTPSQHRKSPSFQPDRQTIAQFWDTPTPFAGLRPEVEQGYSRLLQTGSADDVLAYARDNGFTLDPEDVRGFVADRDAGKSVSYEPTYAETPAPLTDLGDGRTGATVRGVGDGVLAGGLDEAGAVVDTLGLTPGRESIWNSDRRLADIWSNNQQQNSAILGYDDYAHPGWRLGGQVAGGLMVPFGSKARTVPQLFRVGAAYGGAEGFLGTDGSIGQRAIGGAVGVPVGGAIGAAGGKALDYALARIASRFGNRRAVEGAGEAGEGYADERLMNGVQNAVQDGRADDWASFPDAMPMRAEMGDALSQPVTARPLLAGPTEAQLRAASEAIMPQDVLPVPSNVVADVEEALAADAGRYAEVKPVDEKTLIESRGIRTVDGREVRKRGPMDLVTWLRSEGGLRDEGGELSTMGFTNASRDLDLARGEQRFGKLVDNQRGMTLDDAALKAWEAGYLPGNERPDINTLLDALDRTHSGRERFYRPEDLDEVARFENAQAERLDLEERIGSEGPIWRDMSEPADDAPFAPPEAFEDWGPSAPDFAGNIRLANLESPQDIARALSQTEKRIGFDAATRGRVTQAETEALAADLNMTAEQLLSRRKGQAFNAEEALAARQLLAKSGNELVNAAKRIRALDDPGDEKLAEFRQKWMRHVAIQEQVAGMTAEAGRTLQQFRMTADSRAIRGDVLSALVRSGGGKDGLKDAADILIDAVEMGPGKFNALAEKAAKPKWRNRVSELYINFLLSNPPTHVVNMVSNTLTAIAQVPEYATGAAIGAARKALGSGAEDRVLASEVGARAIGLLQGAKEGAQMFAKALRTGEASDFVSKVEGDEYKAIGGKLGEAIRIPTRLLTAEDELFKGVARRMELNAQAVRIANREGLKGDEAKARIAELVADPTDGMLERSMDYGRYLTFQRQLGEFGQGLSRITSSNLPAKVIVPFVRTPINLMKFATERSPAAPLLKEWRRDFGAGGARRDMAIARVLLGTGFAMAMYEAALDGRITGAVPPDPAKARLMYADGWQPYSVKIGDRYISYSRLDPFSTTIGVAADMATLPEGLSDRQKEDKATMLVASIMGNLASKTWLSGMSSFVEGLADPGRYAGNWLERTVSAFAVPAGVAGVARAIDPVSRKRDSVGEAIQARVPGMSQDLMPLRDVFGEPVENDSLGPDLISPFWQSQAKNDPVVAEMLRIGKSVSAPGKQYTEDGERVDYTPQEYDRYHEIAGRLTYNALNDLVTSPAYGGMTDDERRRAAKKAITAARKTARESLSETGFALPERGASNWSAFPTAEDPWAAFEDAQ